MVKIEESYYPVCVRVKKEEASACYDAAYAKGISVAMYAEAHIEDEVIISFVFETDMSKILFNCNGYAEAYFPIAWKITGSIEEKDFIKEALSDIGKLAAKTKEKKLSSGTSLKNESGILALVVFESSEAREKVKAAIASKGTQ